jgi:hypothetical protein
MGLPSIFGTGSNHLRYIPTFSIAIGNLLPVQEKWLPAATDTRPFYQGQPKSANFFFEDN